MCTNLFLLPQEYDRTLNLPPLWPLTIGFTLILGMMAHLRFSLPVLGSVLSKVEAKMLATLESVAGEGGTEKSRLLFDWARSKGGAVLTAIEV